MATDGDERGWDVGWEGHSLAQLRRMARLPLSEKLDWLEEAQRLATRLAAGTRAETTRREDGEGPPPARSSPS
ncbi:MAG: hypothetical protein AAB113_07645 [Candidatus Eisenbacteria bacterium]